MDNKKFIREHEEIIPQIKRIPALKPFKEEDLQELLRLSEIRKYSPGDVIFEEGTYGAYAYYLVSGKASIFKNNKQLAVMKRTGDVFGEMGVINGSSRSASVVALEDTICIAIDLTDIDQLSIDNRYAFKYIIYREFAEILANRLRVTSQELVRANAELDRLSITHQLLSKTEELSEAKEEIARLKQKIKS